MAALVVGEDALLLVGDDAPLLQARDDPLERRVEVVHRDASPRRGGRRRSRPRCRCSRDRRRSGPTSGVRSTRSSTSSLSGLPRMCTARISRRPLQVGRLDQDLAVESAGPEQRRVEVLQAVRRAHHDDLVARAEPVELDEQLVQRLILLAVETVAAPRLADGVELVDEHDRRRIPPRLFEQLADASCAEPGEHLDERRCALRVEARAGFVGDRFRCERLAGARRAVEEDALRHARAKPLELRPARAGSRRSPAAPLSPRRGRRRRPR